MGSPPCEIGPPMSEQPRQQSGFGRNGDRRNNDRAPRAPRVEEWVPTTKLGRLVKAGKINSIEEIFYHSLPIKEYQIVDKFLKLEEDVVRVVSVQKATKAGPRNSFKAFVIVGDNNGHVGLGVKTAREPAVAIRAAIIAAKQNIVPVRRGYWGGNIGAPHTVNCAVSGKCGSISVRLIPAPRGAGLVCAPAIRKILQFAGLEDVYTNSVGHTCTTGNFVRAAFYALAKTYSILTPDIWASTHSMENVLSAHSEFLAGKQ